MSAFGGLYNNTPQTITLGIGTASQIPLPTAMPLSNITSAANSLTIAQTGVYEINYFSLVSVALGTTLTFAVRRNGTDIPDATISRLLSINVGSAFSGSIIISLTAGDVIDMAVSALISVGVTLGSGVNATLSVKKISN